MEAIGDIYSAELAGLSPQQLKPLLSDLELAAVAHFKHENSVLLEIGDSASQSQETRSDLILAVYGADISEHLAEHARALIELETITHAFYSGTRSAKQKLSRELKAWFIEHATKYDAHLKAFFLAKARQKSLRG